MDIREETVRAMHEQEVKYRAYLWQQIEDLFPDIPEGDRCAIAQKKEFISFERFSARIKEMTPAERWVRYEKYMDTKDLTPEEIENREENDPEVERTTKVLLGGMPLPQNLRDQDNAPPPTSSRPPSRGQAAPRDLD